MNENNRYKITSDAFADIIIESARYQDEFSPEELTVLNERYSVAYIPVTDVSKDSINVYGYEGFPSCFNLTSYLDIEASGINRIQQLPNLGLRGNGVIVGIIDTGIDYRHPAFLQADGTTRILSIWDQSIESDEDYPPNFYYGTEYNREKINEALASENPLDIVPTTDTIGHGTLLTGVIAGTESPENNFTGIVPGADLMVVKLKEAKTFNREFFLIPENAVCYQENDIILGIKYLMEVAYSLRRAIAVCIGLGTNQGGHDNRGILSTIVSSFSEFAGVSIVTSGGNELNQRHHYLGRITQPQTDSVVELNIGSSRPSFSLELWGTVPSLLTAEIKSPSGERMVVPPSRVIETRRRDLIFEDTTIWVNNISLEAQTGDQLILFRFQNPAEGVWRFRITSKDSMDTTFHMWLPSREFISEDTVFVEANPNTIIQSPGNVTVLMTVGAYDSQTGSIYINSSRGPSRPGGTKPDFCAPGVNILGPGLNNTYRTGTGTGLAAAHVTGISAMLLEWGVTRGNYPFMGTPEIKSLLVRGTVKAPGIIYPNNTWGYGKVNVYDAFQSLIER